MAFLQYIQDATLDWLRGSAFPPPPSALYLSLHSSTLASPGDEVSSAVGGRVLVNQSDFSTTRWLNGVDGGTREIVNNRAIVFDIASSQIEAVTFAIWDAPVSGVQLLKGDVIPDTTIAEGDPAVFLSGSLSLRVV